MKYESKQQQINKPAQMIYDRLSSFENFTPILASKVEEWQATDDHCSFRAQGFSVALAMMERTAPTLIKIGPAVGCGIPFPFTFFIQLKEVAPNDTRMRIVADMELNIVFKAMVGSKLQGAIDKLALQMATAFNQM
ncbi:MAG: polyketide cyclase [Mucinivorans sp.]